MADKFKSKKMDLRRLMENLTSVDRLSVDKQKIDSRTRALNIVHNQFVGMEVSLQKDMCALQRQYYTNYFKPLQDLRSYLLALVTTGFKKPSVTEIVHQIQKTKAFDPSSVEYQRLIKHCHLLSSAGPSLKEQQFTDNFWLKVLLNSQSSMPVLIQDSDVEILKYLIDIKCDSLKLLGKVCDDLNDEDVNGFQITFRFGKGNPYFENRKLIKRYVIDIYPKERQGVRHLSLDKEDNNLFEGDALLKYGGPRLVAITGTKIIWKEGSEHQPQKADTRGGLGSMMDYFQFSWAEAISEGQSSKAEYDFMVGTYFRDTLVTNAYEIYRNSYVNPNPSASFMTSTKSCSATQVGATSSTGGVWGSLGTSLSTPAIRSNQDHEGQDLGGCSQVKHQLTSSAPQGTSKTPDHDRTRRSFFTLLQRGHAPKINMVCKNLFDETLRRQAQNDDESTDCEMKGGRKRGFSRSDAREFEDRYPLKCIVPSSKEVMVQTDDSYQPTSSSCLSSVAQPSTSTHQDSPPPPPRIHKLKSRHKSLSEIGSSTSANNLQPLAATFSELLNQFYERNPCLYEPTYSQFKFVAPEVSCGALADSDDESGWVDLPLDALSTVVQASNVKQIIRGEENSKRRASRIKKMREAARNTQKHGKTRSIKKVGSVKTQNSNKAASSKPESSTITQKRRRKSRIIKMARRSTNRKFVSAKDKFLKRRSRLRKQKLKLALMNNNQLPATTSTKTKRDLQPIARDAKSWLTVSDGASDQQEDKSESDSSNSLLSASSSSSLSQSPPPKLAKKLTSKARTSRGVTSRGVTSTTKDRRHRPLQKITPLKWKGSMKKNSSRSDTGAAASRFVADGKRPAVSKRCDDKEPAKDATKRALEVSDPTLVPRSSSRQVIQHLTNFPFQNRQNSNNNNNGCVRNESFEKRKMHKLAPRPMPVWFDAEESFVTTSHSMHCHGTRADGVAPPMAKQLRRSLSLCESASSKRALKRKLDPVDDETSPAGKVQRSDNMLRDDNDLDTKPSTMSSSNSHQCEDQTEQGFFERLAGTMFRATKRYFTGEIKKVP